MAKSQLVPSVCQALILFACSSIVWHNITTKVIQGLENHEALQNFTAAQKMVEAMTSNSTNFTSTSFNGSPSIFGTQHINVTITSGHNTTNSDSSEESFYTKTLPRELLFAAIIFPFHYLFQMWLERMFPGRPRPTIPPVGSEKVSEDSDAQEDELIKRLLAQGRIRRSSLSWWNTFIKFFLDMTIGQMLKDHVAHTLLEAAWNRHALKTVWSNLKWGLLAQPFVTLFSFRPLASLLSFIVVPAHKRIVFVEGADLLWCTFIGVFLSTVAPWFMNTEFARMIIGNMTEGAEKAAADKLQSAMATLPSPEPSLLRIGDEL